MAQLLRHIAIPNSLLTQLGAHQQPLHSLSSRHLHSQSLPSLAGFLPHQGVQGSTQSVCATRWPPPSSFNRLICHLATYPQSSWLSTTSRPLVEHKKQHHESKRGHQYQWQMHMGTGGARKVIELQEADEKEHQTDQKQAEGSDDGVRKEMDFDKSLKKRESKLTAHQSVIAHMSDVRTPRSLLNKSQKQIWDVSSRTLYTELPHASCQMHRAKHQYCIMYASASVLALPKDVKSAK